MRHIHAKLCDKIPFYHKWHEHPLAVAAHWSVFILFSTIVTSALLNAIQKTYAITGPGVSITTGFQTPGFGDSATLTSLKWNGLEFIDLQGGSVGVLTNIYDTKGNVMSFSGCSGKSLNSQTNTLSWTCANGSYSITFSSSGDDMYVDSSVTNNTGIDIGSFGFTISWMKIPGFQIQMVSADEGSPGINVYSFTAGQMFLAGSIGFRTGQNGAYQLGGGMSKIPTGQTVTSRGVMRFTLPGTSIAAAMPDALAEYRTQYPMLNFWTDRRPIGTWFMADTPCTVTTGCSTDWSKNINGWFNDSTVDVTTTAGKQAWAQRMLAMVDSNITYLKDANAQGVILWDLEGNKWPQCTTYIGDPRYAETFAPEWGTMVSLNDGTTSSSSIKVIDAVFLKFKNAGIKTGITIRPNRLDWTLNPAYDDQCAGGDDYGPVYGVRPSQEYLDNRTERIALLEAKIAYAYNRWGVTLFYIDSTSWAADGMDMLQIHKDYPQVLLMPENTRVLDFSASLPFNYTSKYGGVSGAANVSEILATVYPRAAGILNSTADTGVNEPINHYWELVNAVRQGNVLLFNSAWNTPDRINVKKIYTAAALPVVSPTVSTGGSSIVADTSATLSGVVGATGGTYVTSRGFEYGLTTTYGSIAKADGVFDTNVNNPDANFSLNVTGLTCGTTYHYRAFAKNLSGSYGQHNDLTGYGADQTFTTTGAGCGTTNPPPVSDTTGPSITSFIVPSISSSLTVPVTFTAVDDTGVAAYLIKETSTIPSLGDAAWAGSVPASYTFGSSGSKTLYAWVMDAAGNMSASKSARVSVTIVVAPTTYTLTYTAGPDGSITGTSPQSITAGSSGSSVTAVANSGFHFVNWSDGSTSNPRTDTNVSRDIIVTASFTQNTTNGGDTTSPVVTVFTIPSTSITTTIPITAFSATDNVGVTGYLVSESSTVPSITSTSWKTLPITSYTFKSTTGARTLYAWAKDAAGNISAAKTASVKLNIRGNGKK